MKSKISGIIAIIVLVALFSSCEKDIKIDIPQTPEKVVIEGSIDLNDYSMVAVTKTLPYFGTIDSAAIFNLIIQDAVVVVSDGVTSETLIKTFNPNYFPPIFYQGTQIKGVVGKTYYLTVKVEGKTFTSRTTIPPTVPVDSLWFKLDVNQDSLGYVWARFTDPTQPGNYYRVFTKRQTKDKAFAPMLFSSVYSDVFFNGQTFTFSIERGETFYDPSKQDPTLGYFKLGDTIVIKACTIDQASYNFWRSAEANIYGGGDPFMNPSQVVTNIAGGALGGWCGYGSEFYTVIAK